MTAAPVPADVLLGGFAEGRWPDLRWLDGGAAARSVAGLEAEVMIEDRALEVLDEVERAWQHAPMQRWIGVLGYEVGRDALLGRPPAAAWPGVSFAAYAAVVEFGAGAPAFVGEPAAAARLQAGWPAASTFVAGPWPLGPLQATLDADTYRRRVAAVKARIAAGDTYQVNLSQPFVAAWQHDAPRDRHRAAADVYARLRSYDAAMGALMAVGDRVIVSNSPETLLEVERGAGEAGGDLVRSRPIKGTRRRGNTAAADAHARAELEASEKDRAEHVMIVDLVRNDLGRLCRAGTVHADRRPQVLSLPTVHHLVTEVRGTLRPGVGLRELVAAVFPGGSITGAPKRRTVEIIESLEDHPRGIYCGAIALLEPRGLSLSIPIRTGVLADEGLYVPAGGGIVADSDPEAERRETIDKTRAFSGPTALA